MRKKNGPLYPYSNRPQYVVDVNNVTSLGVKMNKLTSKIIALVATSFIISSFFVTSIGTASADTNTTSSMSSGDLSLTMNMNAADRAFGVVVTNNGTDPITSFHLDIQKSSNFTITDALALPAGFSNSNPTDNGTFDISTGIWTGNIGHNESVALGLLGDADPNALGQTFTITSTITSSTLADSTPNVDPDSSNDSASYTSQPILLDPHMKLTTRLLTSGPIVNGTPLTYEVTIANTGAGDYYDLGQNFPLGLNFRCS